MPTPIADEYFKNRNATAIMIPPVITDKININLKREEAEDATSCTCESHEHEEEYGENPSLENERDPSAVWFELDPEEMLETVKRLTEDTMYQNLRKMEYAVRGSVVIAADKISEKLKQNDKSNNKLGFDHIVYTNIGNPQAIGQKPLTWPRQVLALVDLPNDFGIHHKDVDKMFPKDAIERAKEIKATLSCQTSGAYSHSKGVKLFRQDVANFISERDGGLGTDPEDIFLTNGASAGIQMILTALIADETCGVMIPIPQYPIYSATIELLGGQKIGYYLDEENGWDLNINELERSLQEAKEKGTNVNSFVLINPGNPTGQVLKRKSLHEVVNFCSKHKLVLLADEVYQENIYDENSEFISCKKAADEVGLFEHNALELVSFHSISKGVFGECGRRGGYMELVGIDTKVKEHIYKLASSCLCSTLSGQIMLSLMVRGPDKDDISYNMHENEKLAILESLKKRSKLLYNGLNTIDGFACQKSQGAMYCFPSIKISDSAIHHIKKHYSPSSNMTPDTFYALSLLHRTGICVVPASGFGQRKGRFGFRTTFLPPEDEIENVIKLFRIHHEEFCTKYP